MLVKTAVASMICFLKFFLMDINYKSIIIKSFVFIILVASSLFLSPFFYLLIGTLVSGILNPLPHEHDYYICQCVMPPLMSKTQAIVLGIIYIILLMIVFYYLLRKMNLSKRVFNIALIILFLVNIFSCNYVKFLLYTRVGQ